MKHIVLSMILAAVLVSCTGKATKEKKTEDQQTEPVEAVKVEAKPFHAEDVDRLIQLYKAEEPESSYKEMGKWCLVDVDGDGQDEVWLRSEDDEYGALFSIVDEPKLIFTEDNRMPMHVFSGYVMKSGPAGGPSYFYQYCTLRGSQAYQRVGLMEVYGDFSFGSINEEDVEEEEAARFRESLSGSELDYDKLEWKSVKAD